MERISWTLFLLSLVASGVTAQDFGQTQFICTSVPKDMDLCAATMQNSGPAEDLKTTVMQLRETVLQQKETIMNQKETIRELTSKLNRCESQSGPEPGAGGGRRKEQGKNTMGDNSRGAGDTLAQLGQTLATLKQRLENLEVQFYQHGSTFLALQVLFTRNCIASFQSSKTSCWICVELVSPELVPQTGIQPSPISELAPKWTRLSPCHF